MKLLTILRQQKRSPLCFTSYGRCEESWSLFIVDVKKNRTQYIQKLISLFLVVALAIPAPLYADGSDGTPANLNASDTLDQQPQELQTTDKEALEAFKRVRKMADGIFDFKAYSRFRSPTGETLPFTFAYGEFGGTLSKNETIQFGRDILRTNSDYVIFTIPSREKEAIEFRLKYEEELRNEGIHKRVLVVVVPDRYEEQLNRDYEIAQMNPFKRAFVSTGRSVVESPKTVATMFKIAKAQFVPTRKEDEKRATKWGFITAGVYASMFFYLGTTQPEHFNTTLAYALTYYAAVASYVFNLNNQRITNIFRAKYTRDFRATSTTRQVLTNLVLLSGGASLGAYGLGTSIDPVQDSFKLTPEQVAGNVAAQYGQAKLNLTRMDQLTEKASNRIWDYVLGMNLIFRSMAMTGLVGFTFDLGIIELTGIQFVIFGANIGLERLMVRYKRVFEHLGNGEFKKISEASMNRLRKAFVSKAKVDHSSQMCQMLFAK